MHSFVIISVDFLTVVGINILSAPKRIELSLDGPNQLKERLKHPYNI